MTYDFIIVGSGPAGAALAYRLASSRAAPKVLLLEAGGNHGDDESAQLLGSRFATFATHPHLDWQYMTEPQKHLANRKLGYNRGKGLGGSSAINFCFYTRGAKADFDEWARRVGDDFFSWENAERRFKKLEGFSSIETESHKKYADWKPENHGTDGPVKISDSNEWESHHEDVMEAGYQNGWKKNMDVNSGDPIGLGVCATTGLRGKRTTAATAYLNSAPSNLEIVTDALATKIIFDGRKAVGVTACGKDYFAENELILSAGALDTPKLLMLSGVGPSAELAKHGISQIADLPVGLGLQDHLHFSMVVEVQEGTNLRAKWSTPEFMAKATEQFKKDGTGPLSIIYNSAAVGFAKGSDSIYESQEFKDLPKDIQAYYKQPTVPSYEFVGLAPTAPLPGFDPTKTYQTVMTFGMTPMSRGSITLRSANPADPPISDPNFLMHPWDRLVMLDAIKQTYKWLHHPLVSASITGALALPKSTSDEDLLEYIQNWGSSTWHMCSTAMMGKADSSTAVVTSDFKVKGFENLRIADLSVIPFVPNAHTVSTGYLIGETAAEKLIAEYGLDA